MKIHATTIVGVNEECSLKDPQDQSQLSHACAVAMESLPKEKTQNNLAVDNFNNLRYGLLAANLQ